MRTNKARWVGCSVAMGALIYGLLWPAPALRAQVRAPSSGETAFRELYKELVEINSDKRFRGGVPLDHRMKILHFRSAPAVEDLTGSAIAASG